jgi:hypothetical protein
VSAPAAKSDTGLTDLLHWLPNSRPAGDAPDSAPAVAVAASDSCRTR